MRRLFAMALLGLGCVLAATGGARNGPTLVAHRTAVAVTAEGQAPTVALPGPSQRLSEWFVAGGLPWGVGVGLVIVGALLARKLDKDEATGSDGSGVEVDFGERMEEALRRLRAIDADLATLAMDDSAPKLREALDLLTDEVLTPVVDARGRFQARHGITPFAEYFGEFAAGERTAARCWSALVDGHAVVARSAMADAVMHFEEALAGWRRAEAGRR
jgi:hypothetical protein